MINITPPDFMVEAEAAHAKEGLNFGQYFDHAFTHGFVVKTPVSFVLAFPDPMTQASDHPALLVWWCQTFPKQRDPRVMLKLLLPYLPYPNPWPRLCWNRRLRNDRGVVYYSTQRLARFIARPRPK